MTWTRIDDSFWCHPKVTLAGNEATGAYVRMLSYCGQYLTDGFVNREAARLIAKPSTLRRLVQHQLIEEAEGGWQIPDYLEFNPPKEKVQKDRAAARKRMQELRGNGR